MTFSTRKLLLIGSGLAILAICFHPRLKILIDPSYQNYALAAYTQPPQEAQSLWQKRDLATVGYFQNIDGWPEGIFVQTYPFLREINFVQAMAYSSPTIQSLDLILRPDEVDKIIPKLPRLIDLNSAMTFKDDRHTWVFGLYDQTQAKQANGYFSTLSNEEVVWLHMSVVNEKGFHD